MILAPPPPQIPTKSTGIQVVHVCAKRESEKKQLEFPRVQETDKSYPTVRRARQNRAARRNKALQKALEINKVIEGIQALVNSDEALGEVMENLYKLRTREEDKEFGIRRPTPYAFNTALRFLISARTQMEHDFPDASIGTDSDGSIHVHWIGGERELTLVVPAKKSEKGYVYYESAKGYNVDEDVSIDGLANWIKWVAENER